MLPAQPNVSPLPVDPRQGAGEKPGSPSGNVTSKTPQMFSLIPTFCRAKRRLQRMSSELPEASRNIRRSSTELLAASRNLRRTSADIGAASLSILPVRGELGAASLSIWQPNAALETKSQEVPICTATLTARSLTFRAFAVDCFARFQVLRRRLALLPPVTPVVGSYFVPGTYKTFAAKCSPTDPVARNELLWELAEPWRMIRYGSRPLSLAADTSHRGWMCLSTCSPEAAPSSQPAPSAPQVLWAWFVQQAEWFARSSPCWALASPYFTFSIR